MKTSASSSWNALAKMPPEERKKYLHDKKRPKNRAKVTESAFGGVTYMRMDLAPPKGLDYFVWHDGWDEGE